MNKTLALDASMLEFKASLKHRNTLLNKLNKSLDCLLHNTTPKMERLKKERS